MLKLDRLQLTALDSVPTTTPYANVSTVFYAQTDARKQYQALGEVPHFRYFDFHAAPEDKTQGTYL